MQRTRRCVLGSARKNSGSPRRTHPTATTLVRRSDMAKHHLSWASPANRHEVTHTSAHHEPCRALATTREAIPVEEPAREQTAAILPGNYLAAMQVPGQDEVIAGIAGSL